MARHGSDVKRLSQRVAGWIDSHPRTGWYVAIWAALISLDALVDLYSKIAHLLG